jgi:hypothetical protein
MTPGAIDQDFANETAGFNLIPFASMAGGWLGPLLMFWLYVWGPLRPFHYTGGDLLPSLPLCLAFLQQPSLCGGCRRRTIRFATSSRVAVSMN